MERHNEVLKEYENSSNKLCVSCSIFTVLFLYIYNKTVNKLQESV